jgi:hypothetical protein
MGPVRIVCANREQNGLLGRESLPIRAMGKERIVAKGPQMLIEGIAAIFRTGLHHHPPAALQAALQQAGKRILQCCFGQVIKQYLCHFPAAGFRIRL